VGAVPNAYGASISGSDLTLQPADATHPGVVTIDTQTFAGEKTFSDNVIFNGPTLTTAGNVLSFTGSGSKSITSAVSAATATSTTTPGFLIKTTVLLDANDKHTIWRNQANLDVMSVDVEGDVVVTGGITTTGNITSTADAAYNLGAPGTAWATGWINSIRDTGNNTRLSQTATLGSFIAGNVANGSSAHAIKTGNNTTLSTAGAQIEAWYNDAWVTKKAAVDLNGFYLQSAQTTITVADDAAGTKPTDTLTPTGLVTYACNDATGVTVTLSETGAQNGSHVYILNTGSGNCEFADTAGLTELAGAFVMGATDTLHLIYMNSAWHEIGRSDN
jgi:hypothetical protein